MKESDIERRLIAGVSAQGGACYKWVSPGCTGVPDRIVILPGGRIIFVELKSAQGRLSVRQRFILRRLLALGADARVLRGQAGVDMFLREMQDL